MDGTQAADRAGNEIGKLVGTETGSTGQQQGIQSVELAMLVLQAIEQGAGPMSLTQISQGSGMAPSKAHRYLVSLCRVGLVARSQTSGLYDLGPAMRRLGIESLRRMDEVGLAAEHLPGLRDRTLHAVNLAVWGDYGPVVVRWDYGSYALPITVRIGATMSLLSSSIGRVFLAYLPETLTEPVLRSQAESSRAESSRAEIDKIKQAVRRDGLAVTSGRVAPGVTSIAAPVFSAADSLPLVIAIALPAPEATESAVKEIGAELLLTCAAISTELGHTDRS